jgi:hypothetical protein
MRIIAAPHQFGKNQRSTSVPFGRRAKRPSAPLAKVCYRRNLGKLMLVTSFSYPDPKRAWVGLPSC